MITELFNKKRELAQAQANAAGWRRILAAREARLAEIREVWGEAETVRQRLNGAVFEALTAPGAVVDARAMYVPGQEPAGEPGAPARLAAAKARYDRAADDAAAANREMLQAESDRYETQRALSFAEQHASRLHGEVAALEAERAALLDPEPAPPGQSLLEAFVARQQARG